MLFKNDMNDMKMQEEYQEESFRIEITEDEEHYYITAEVPGRQLHEIKLRFKGSNSISIKLEEGEQIPDDQNIIVSERIRYETERVLNFDELVNKESVKAFLKDGLLTVEIEKLNADKEEDLILITKE